MRMALLCGGFMSREEIHTPKTLDQRNGALYLLASRLGVDSYDGMDIGPIQKQDEPSSAGNCRSTGT